MKFHLLKTRLMIGLDWRFRGTDLRLRPGQRNDRFYVLPRVDAKLTSRRPRQPR